MEFNGDNTCGALFRNGRVELDHETHWPEGQRLIVAPVVAPLVIDPKQHVIVVGFGLAGRCVADLLDLNKIPYVIVEMNRSTVATQAALGRRVFFGDISQAEVLVEAGIASASILALTIPNEEAVLAAIAIARRYRPQIHIIARTQHASKGMAASQLGADDVIKAEQAVAVQFYELLKKRLGTVGESCDAHGTEFA